MYIKIYYDSNNDCNKPLHYIPVFALFVLSKPVTVTKGRISSVCQNRWH